LHDCEGAKVDVKIEINKRYSGIEVEIKLNAKACYHHKELGICRKAIDAALEESENCLREKAEK